jgi:hypothetical protein
VQRRCIAHHDIVDRDDVFYREVSFVCEYVALVDV